MRHCKNSKKIHKQKWSQSHKFRETQKYLLLLKTLTETQIPSVKYSRVCDICSWTEVVENLNKNTKQEGTVK